MSFPGTEPCENCATPVTVIKITGVAKIDERPRLYELIDEGSLTEPTRWTTHTPERCRTARQEKDR